MWLKDDAFSVRLGGNIFIHTRTLVAFDESPVFTLYRKPDDGYAAIDFPIHNQAGTKVAWVKKNNIYIVAGHVGAHAIVGDANRVALVEKASGAVLAEVNRQPESPSVLLDVNVKTYLPNGALLDATPNSINLGNCTFINNTFSGLRIGIQLRSKGGMGIGIG